MNLKMSVTMYMVIWGVGIKASYLLKCQLVHLMVMFQHKLNIMHQKIFFYSFSYYLDAKDIKVPDLSDSVYTLGALKIHHVKRLNLKTANLYLNR